MSQSSFSGTVSLTSSSLASDGDWLSQSSFSGTVSLTVIDRYLFSIHLSQSSFSGTVSLTRWGSGGKYGVCLSPHLVERYL